MPVNPRIVALATAVPPHRRSQAEVTACACRMFDRDASEIVVDARRRPQPSFADRVADALAGGGRELRLVRGPVRREHEHALGREGRDRVLEQRRRRMLGSIRGAIGIGFFQAEISRQVDDLAAGRQRGPGRGAGAARRLRRG